MKNKERLEFIHDINTFMASTDNETHLCGTDSEGNDIHVIFNTIELLEWIAPQIDYMKEQSKKYIETL